MTRLGLWAVVAAWALAACGSGAEPPAAPPPPPATATPTTATSAAAPPASSAAATSAQQTPAALRFTGTTLTGSAFDGASLTGRPVVFWFWAPWCPKCQAEGPAVAKIAEKYRDRVAVVGVAGLDRSTQKMTEFVDRTGTSKLPQLNDTSGALYKHFRVTSQSSYLFVDPAGGTESATGPLDEDELSSLIERHLL
ncbi:redoxin domain-containing protein [Actinoplanes sp. NEAU-A12]|uniref:Redoxin domain-containing protein n=1 Tax=Actinoplanes sandaracinus TaxID=3045177 RepID=A0ABT6WUF0_9ACTN|nr:redoxin domain-containing protein [Actinoplanes sandaracinus]MDI6103368.1 redoxin domain-containing protein [Actinoplanes sandaracinus]